MAACALTACGEAAPSVGLAPAEAQALVEAHRAEFERFEAWAHRTASADARFEDEGALREVAFTPIRREATIALAEIDRSGMGDLHLVHPEGATLPELALVPVAGAGGIEVALATIGEGDEADATVVLSRQRSLEGDSTLRVTVAFRAAP